MNIELQVPDMACEVCASTITKAVHNLDSQARVKANPQTKQVIIETEVSVVAVKEAVTAAGFTPI